PCECRKFPGGCTSSALGVVVDFGTLPTCPAPPSDEYLGFNARGRDRDAKPFRMIDATAGLPRHCRGNKKAQARCVDWDSSTSRKAEPLPLAPEATMKRLRGLGDALVARRDFWEAAVDRELHRYLGWWQTSFVRPDSDLPELRRVLTDELMKTGNVRA